jgi:hypothetical protein
MRMSGRERDDAKNKNSVLSRFGEPCEHHGRHQAVWLYTKPQHFETFLGLDVKIPADRCARYESRRNREHIHSPNLHMKQRSKIEDVRSYQNTLAQSYPNLSRRND